MKYLNIKLLRDLKNQWAQFLSAALMAFLAILLFVGLQGAWKGLETSINQYSRNNNLANYWVQVTNVKSNDIPRLKEISGIKKIAVGTQFQATSHHHQITVEGFNKQLTYLYPVNGKILSHNSKGIWINKEYARGNKIKVGDAISLKYENTKAAFKVEGIIQSPSKLYYTGTSDYIAPNYSKYGYAYVPIQYLKKKYPVINNNYLEIYGYHKDMRKQVETIFGKRLIRYDNRATLEEVSTGFERVKEIRNLSYLFSFIFILLALLAMATTIRRLVKDQMSEIAILKALGFTNRDIGFHYGNFGLLIGGIGVTLGFLCSPLVSLFVLSTQKAMFSLPTWHLAYTLSALGVSVLVIVICVLSAYLAASSTLRGYPAEFLHGKQDENTYHIILEKIPNVWEKLSYGLRWIARDAFFNKVRILMGIVGVAGGMMLMIAGLGMPQSINHLVRKTYNQDYNYSKKLTINNYSDFLALHPRQKGQWLQVSQAHFSKDDGYNRYLMVIGKGNYINLKTKNHHKIKNGGVYVTDDFARRAKIKVGSEIKIKTFGEKKKHIFRVKGIVDSEINQGVYMTAETWRKAGEQYKPNSLLIGKNTIYPKKEVSSTVSIASQKRNAYNFVNNLMSVFILIIMFAVILIVVVLYNLGSLGFIERYRDYATLRVLGMHKRELRKLTFVENIITTLIGWLIGIPAGIWFLDRYVATFTTLNIDYRPYINFETLFIASVFVWLCSMSTTLFLNRRIQKINMVKALKGVE